MRSGGGTTKVALRAVNTHSLRYFPTMANEPSLGPGVTTSSSDLAARAGQKPEANTASPDASLIEQTRREIQQIASEVGELSRQEIPPADYYAQFLPKVISALGALGGAIWKVGGGNDAGVSGQSRLGKIG